MPSLYKASLVNIAGLLKELTAKYVTQKEVFPLISLPILSRWSLGTSVEMQIAQYGG